MCLSAIFFSNTTLTLSKSFLSTCNNLSDTSLCTVDLDTQNCFAVELKTAKLPYQEKYSILYSDKAKRIDVCVEMWYNYRSKYWAGINMCKKKKQKSNDVLYYPVEDFSKSLAIPFEIGCDILEANIDLVTENEVLKSLPVIKYLVAAKDVGVSIYKGHQAKKLISFFQKLNQFIDDPSIQEMRKKSQISIRVFSKKLEEQIELKLITDRKIMKSEINETENGETNREKSI